LPPDAEDSTRRRVLCDESVPHDIAAAIVGHEVATVQGLGWAGAKNGAPLRAAREAGYEVLVTVDRNLEYQQTSRRAGSLCSSSKRAQAAWRTSGRPSPRCSRRCPRPLPAPSRMSAEPNIIPQLTRALRNGACGASIWHALAAERRASRPRASSVLRS
jgi:hypothetical protein